MKTLYILRHAKSSWDFPEISDHERPLIEKGVIRTKKIIAYLQKRDIKIDLMVSSDARRAIETALLLADGLGYHKDELVKNNALYHASEEDIYNLVFALPDIYNHVLLIGHNPTFTQFANNFLKPRIDYLPTSGLVSITFKTDTWMRFAAAPFEQNFVLIPKKL